MIFSHFYVLVQRNTKRGSTVVHAASPPAFASFSRILHVEVDSDPVDVSRPTFHLP